MQFKSVHKIFGFFSLSEGLFKKNCNNIAQAEELMIVAPVYVVYGPNNNIYHLGNHAQ